MHEDFKDSMRGNVPLTDLVTVDERNCTPSTVLSLRPPTEPIESPWPPEQYPFLKMILVPELMATQSSWL